MQLFSTLIFKNICSAFCVLSQGTSGAKDAYKQSNTGPNPDREYLSIWMSFVQAAESWVPEVTHSGDNATKGCCIYEQRLQLFNMQKNFPGCLPIESTVVKAEMGSDLVYVESRGVLR